MKIEPKNMWKRVAGEATRVGEVRKEDGPWAIQNHKSIQRTKQLRRGIRVVCDWRHQETVQFGKIEHTEQECVTPAARCERKRRHSANHGHRGRNRDA